MTKNQRKTYRESLCTRNILCDFKVIQNLDDIQVERCIFCAKRLAFKKIGGYVHSERYRRAHIRAFAQPFTADHNIFTFIRGRGAVKELVKEAQREEWMEQKSLERDQNYEDELRLIFDGRKFV